MNRAVTMTAVFLASTMLWAASPTNAQTPAGKEPQTPAGKEMSKQVTVTGCVQREADYRKAHDKGRGGVAGTGIGEENEFVLVAATPGRGTPAATETGAGAMTAYELTGENEKLAAPHINHLVEISGMLKPAEMSPAGPTGGKTAGSPPTGVDVMSKDLRLRELEVTSVKMISAQCKP